MMMNVFALTAEGADNAINWGERASTAGVTALLGMVTIFLVLASLWGCIEIMHLLLHRGDKKEKPVKKQAPSASAPTPAADDASIAAAIAAALAASEDDGAVVAAITAAISAMRAEEGCDTAFRVVSFKRAARSGARKRF